jgi:hypothetical protein
MSESSLTIVAAGAALFMVILVRAGLNREMRAAVRTTLVLVLAWAFAYSAGNRASISAVSWTVKAMLALSIVDLAVIWIIALRSKCIPNEQRRNLIDRINIGFAVAFGSLLIARGPFRDAVINAVVIIAAAIVLALNRK